MSRTLSVAAHYLTPCDEATRLDVELVEDDGDVGDGHEDVDWNEWRR